MIAERRWLLPIATAFVAVGLMPGDATAQSWKTVTSSRQVTDEDQIDVDITYAVGVLTMVRGEPESLYRATLRFDEETSTPIAEYDNGRLQVGISKHESRRINIGNWSSEGSLDLELSPRVPMRLELQFGAVKADLDLSGLPIRRLDLSTGASESTLHVDEVNPERMEQATFQVGAADFTVRGVGNLNADEVSVRAGVGSVDLGLDGDWPRDGRVTIEMGLGALELRIPESLGVRLRRSSFLTSIDVDGMVKRGNAYHSANWETADRKLDIDVSAALGSVEVIWTR